MTQAMPTALTKTQVEDLTEKTVSSVKRLDCSYYNACLDVAVKGDWPGFGCSSCNAYVGMDIDQRVLDWQGLAVAGEAAINMEKHGSAGRRRGVKSGADSKPATRHLNVIQPGMAQENSEPEEETVEVLASSICLA